MNLELYKRILLIVSLATLAGGIILIGSLLVAVVVYADSCANHNGIDAH
jgi:hypothetical protein